MTPLIILSIVVVLAIIAFFLSARIVRQYERGVVLRFGRLHNVREPGDPVHLPDRRRAHPPRLAADRDDADPVPGHHHQGQRDRGRLGRRLLPDPGPVKSVIAIENVRAAIDQIAQTTLRRVVGQHHLDEILSDTAALNANIREILDVITVDWGGVEVTLVELKDILLPDTMKRAMAKQAEAEREKRAKIIAAEGEALAAAQLARRPTR